MGVILFEHHHLGRRKRDAGYANIVLIGNGICPCHDYRDGGQRSPRIQDDRIRFEGVRSLIVMPSYEEDPVRMLRAARFAAKLNFSIHPDTESPIYDHVHLLDNIPSARLFEEILKIYRSGHALKCFKLLEQYGLLIMLFPGLQKKLSRFIKSSLRNTDTRFSEGKSLNPAFLLAVLIWGNLQNEVTRLKKEGVKLFPAVNRSIESVIPKQMKRLSVPRRFTGMMREIWLLQYQLPLRAGKRAYRTFSHPRFRAAYDFLLLRAETDEKLQKLALWWTDFQEVDDKGRIEMVKQLQRRQSK